MPIQPKVCQYNARCASTTQGAVQGNLCEGSHPLAHHLKLIATSHQLGVVAVPQIITAHKVEVLVPARVGPLHGRSVFIDRGEDDFVIKALGGVGVGEGCTPVKVPEGCYLAEGLLCEVCPA